MNSKCAIKNLQEFMEAEARSGAMDFACITPLYVYRMWGGSVAIEKIATGLMELRKKGFMVKDSWFIMITSEE